ncbi:MAG TPA: hypothetical protein VG758_12195 [Hyphomicrobiaceae bacterium]|nr:hypothetical protein [Hyphomicrobiaceae bacterium]
MTFLNTERLLAWIRDENSSTRVAGLQHIAQGVVEVEAFWSEFPRLLRDPSADVRWITAAAVLGMAARDKDIGAFVPHLEELLDDPRVGAFARGAIAVYYVQQRRTDRLRTLIDEGGQSAMGVLSAFVSAKEPSLIEPLLPELTACQSAPDVKLREAATKVLAHYYWLNKSWDKLSEFLLSDDEPVALGAIRLLDGLAEDSKDVDGAVSPLLTILQRRGERFRKTREAAAHALVWLVLDRQPKDRTEPELPESLILHGVDILKIREVKTKVKQITRAARKALERGGYP